MKKKEEKELYFNIVKDIEYYWDGKTYMFDQHDRWEQKDDIWFCCWDKYDCLTKARNKLLEKEEGLIGREIR